MPNRVNALLRSIWRSRKIDVVSLADRARDAGQWELAVQLYREALERHPRNPRIWVQYGHALKEFGELRDPSKLAQAEAAYKRALNYEPAVADTHLQLGHVLKLRGKTEEAQASYLHAFALDPGMRYPLNELHGLGPLNLEAAMKFKRATITMLGVHKGFAVYKARLMLPEVEEIHLKPLESQHAFAKRHGRTFFEWGPAGECFVVGPPMIVGEGDFRPLTGVTRSSYVSCLIDARVRGSSSVIDMGGMALLDYHDSELALFDWEMDIDPSIFQSTGGNVWVIAPKDDRAADIEIEEAFMLLGPQSGGFGDWMMDYLPRYVAANLSGALPPVPVLIDATLPEVHRRSLEMMLPDSTDLVEVPAYATVRVNRLWTAPTIRYAPSYEKMDGRFKFDYTVPAPERFAPVTRAIASRAYLSFAACTGPERVFLARARTSTWRKLVNHEEIEAAVSARGFIVVAPDSLSFAAQVNLIRHANFVVAPEGSSLYLGYFARSGTKLCILNHTLVEWSISYSSLLAGAGVEITIFTGRIVKAHPDFPHRADYEIDANRFSEFLDEWLAGDATGRREYSRTE